VKKFIRKIIPIKSAKDKLFYVDLYKLLGFKPSYLYYYKKAFTHRSVRKLNKVGEPINYERLEFLGDAILSAIIAAYLFRQAPKKNEGYLTQMRSKIVSRKHLNKLSEDLHLIHFVHSLPTKKFGENIHGNIFESLIGAIYLDKGFHFCEKFIFSKLIKPYLNIAQLENKITSYKSLLIEWCQKEKKIIHFDIYEDSGNDTIKQYSVKLFIDDILIAKGRDLSKKKAEEKASSRAYYSLKNQISS